MIPQTIRQRLIDLLESGPFRVQELSQALRISEREVRSHLEHAAHTLKARGERLTIAPFACLACGFVFRDRGRFTSPGRCPRCHGTHIEDPVLSIAR